MQILMKKVNDLIPYINNPRNNKEAIDKVASSIKEFGFKVPIVVDKDNVVVTGHTRLLASKKIGIEEVPCVVANDLSKAQIKAFRIADNKVSEYATWDNDMLKIELEELNELDFNLDSLSIDFSNFNLDFKEMEEFDEFNEFTDYEEGMELERSEGKQGEALKYVKFKNYDIPLTDEEFIRLDKAINDYANKNGVLYGFIDSILGRE